MKKRLCGLLAGILLLTGCRDLAVGTEPVEGTVDVTQPSVDLQVSDTDMFTDRDSRAEWSEGTVISLEGDRAVCDAASVTVSGTTVTIKGDGTYILRGTLEEGQIIVEAGESHKPQLVLDGASITCTTGAALLIREADKVFVTLAEGSENVLTGSGFPEEENVDGAVFSSQDLTFNGSGSLQVSSPEGHGIVCKDDLKITGGSYRVESTSHGLDANDSVRIRAGELTVDAGKDGIHAEHSEDASLGFVYISGGSLDIEAEGDGISASAHLQILGGSLDILAGGGYENGASHSSSGWGDFMGDGGGGMRPPNRRTAETETVTETASSSMKGMKAGTQLQVAGGSITIDAADDGIHSNGAVEIRGGDIQIATGDDGIHGETDLTVTAGTIQITESYEGLEALDILIQGGDISIVASDDGINAAGGTDSSGTGGRDQMFGGGRPGGMGGMGGMSGSSDGSIVVEDGKITVQSSGDGMDANGYLRIDGGYTVVCGPNMGDTATLDYDTSGTITGGVFIGTGASGMAQTFSENEQGVLAVSVGQGSGAGTKISVSDDTGKALVSFQPELDFSVIIISTPDLVSGHSYHVTVGDVEGDLEAY